MRAVPAAVTTAASIRVKTKPGHAASTLHRMDVVRFEPPLIEVEARHLRRRSDARALCGPCPHTVGYDDLLKPDELDAINNS